MNALFRIALAVTGMALATQAAAQVTFYERQGFEGRSFTTEEQVGNFARHGFNDRASSVVVLNDRWEVCEDARFSGQCVVLRPGRYASLAAMGLNNQVSSVRAVGRNARIDDRRYAPVPVAAAVTFYERKGFKGRSFTTEKQIGNFSATVSMTVPRRSWWSATAGKCVRTPASAGGAPSCARAGIRRSPRWA